MVVISGTDKVPERTKQHSETPHQTGPVHVFRMDFFGLWPKNEEECNHGIDKANNIGQHPKSAQFPWSRPDGLPDYSAAKDEGNRHHI